MKKSNPALLHKLGQTDDKLMEKESLIPIFAMLVALANKWTDGRASLFVKNHDGTTDAFGARVLFRLYLR